MMQILAFIALFQQAYAAGYLDILLKSAHDQRATVTLSDGETPYMVLPLNLKKGVEMKFEDLLIDFNKNYTISILMDQTDSLGLSKSLFTGEITPILGTASPKTLNLPLTGARFEFKCEPNFTGETCEEACDSNNKCSSDRGTHNEMQLPVDYTVNPEKLDHIIDMLKKENEVDNTFTVDDEPERQLVEEILEASGEQP